jgi:hypothetical protein
VDLAGNPAAQRRPEQGVFLQPDDTTPNVGVKLGRREEEREWNEPRPPRSVYIVGREGLVAGCRGNPRPPPPWPPPAPRGNPRVPGAWALAGLAGQANGPSPFSLFPKFLLIN